MSQLSDETLRQVANPEIQLTNEIVGNPTPAAPARANLTPRTVTPMDMLDRALANGADIEVLSKLLDLQERHEKNEARRAFDRAIAAAKGKMPPIPKNGTGHNGRKYATLADVAKVINPILGEHGLGFRFRTRQDAQKISVTCVIFHEAGHSEENTLEAPADTSGSKNAIQAIGSSLSYLGRYALMQSLGLAAADDTDDDGQTAANGSETINEAQYEQLRSKIVEANANLERFLANYRIERLEHLPAKSFAGAIQLLNRKAAQAREEGPPL